MVKVAKKIGLVDKRIFKDSLSNLLLFKTFTKPSSFSTDLLHCKGETLSLGDVEVQPSQHVSNCTFCVLETNFESVERGDIPIRWADIAKKDIIVQCKRKT